MQCSEADIFNVADRKGFLLFYNCRFIYSSADPRGGHSRTILRRRVSDTDVA